MRPRSAQQKVATSSLICALSASQRWHCLRIRASSSVGISPRPRHRQQQAGIGSRARTAAVSPVRFQRGRAARLGGAVRRPAAAAGAVPPAACMGGVPRRAAPPPRHRARRRALRRAPPPFMCIYGLKSLSLLVRHARAPSAQRSVSASGLGRLLHPVAIHLPRRFRMHAQLRSRAGRSVAAAAGACGALRRAAQAAAAAATRPRRAAERTTPSEAAAVLRVTGLLRARPCVVAAPSGVISHGIARAPPPHLGTEHIHHIRCPNCFIDDAAPECTERRPRGDSAFGHASL